MPSAPKQPDASQRTALYRYLDGEGHPLYIGISQHLEDRMKAHAHMPWGVGAVGIAIEWFPSKREAALAETRAIRADRPRYNLADNYGLIPFDGTGWPSLADAGRNKALKLAELIRTEIDAGRWPARHKLPGSEELAAATDIGLGAAKHALEHLTRQGYVYRHRAFGHFVRTRPSP